MDDMYAELDAEREWEIINSVEFDKLAERIR